MLTVNSRLVDAWRPHMRGHQRRAMATTPAGPERTMLYIVIERFKDGDAVPVDRRAGGPASVGPSRGAGVPDDYQRGAAARSGDGVLRGAGGGVYKGRNRVTR